MDDSIKIHALEEPLGPKEKNSRKSDKTTHHKIEVQVRQASHGGPFWRGPVASGLPVEV